MKKHTLFLLSFLIFFTIQLNAQDSTAVPLNYDKITAGLGIGQDFGGFGVNLIFYPHKNIGVFGGLGYTLVGAGYNAGIKFRFLSAKPKAKVTPFILAMYGYNAAIKVSGAEDYNKLFFGPTFGLGIDFKSYPRSKIYYSFAIMLPLRGSEVDDYIEDLKTNHNVEFTNDLFPLTFSLGFKYILK